MDSTLTIDENEPLPVDADRLRFDLNAAVEIVAEKRIGLERRRKELLGDSPKIDAAALAKRRIGLQKLADEAITLDGEESAAIQGIIDQWSAAIDQARRAAYDAAIARHDAIKAATIAGLEQLGWLPSGDAQGRHASQTSQIASRTCPKIHAAAAGVEDALQATQRRFDAAPFRRRIEQLRAGIAKSMSA